MKLTVFNGSPRGAKSNTRVLLEHFLRGFSETEGNSAETYYLNRVHDQEIFREAYTQAETVLLAFPLYTDAMPGVVKLFIEGLRPQRGLPNAPAMACLVQSGFSEAVHSRYVERYLQKLAARLGCRYLGTMVRGGVEGIQAQPGRLTQKLFEAFYGLGKALGATGQLDQGQLQALAGPEHLSRLTMVGMSVLLPTGLLNYSWDMQLKQNGTYDRRFARPYLQA